MKRCIAVLENGTKSPNLPTFTTMINFIAFAELGGFAKTSVFASLRN